MTETQVYEPVLRPAPESGKWEGRTGVLIKWFERERHNLISVPFKMKHGSIHDPERYYKHLESMIRMGPDSWYARWGIIEESLAEIRELTKRGS